MDRESETLRQAKELIRSGRAQEALPRLLALIKADPRSEQAWLWLSYALTDPGQQRDCLQRVLKINPGNMEAAARLDLLMAGQGPAVGHTESRTRLGKLAGSTGMLSMPATPRPVPTKTAPFTTLDEADLRAAPAEMLSDFAQEAPPSPPVEAPPAAATPESPGSWLARLNPDATWEPAASPAEAPPPPPAPRVIVPRLTLPPPRTWSQLLPPPRTWKERFQRLRPPEKIIVGVVVLSMLGCVLAGLTALYAVVSQPRLIPLILSPTPTPPFFPTFPPTWTPSIGASVPTAPPAPQQTPLAAEPVAAPEPTQPPTPNSEVIASMDEIQQQVADVRGLTIQGNVQRYLISKYRLELTARDLLLGPDGEAKLTDVAHVYAALGLIEPAYDLARYALNSQVDNIGGFYVPETRQLFVVGDQFSGLEHYAFAHEYDHALVDQHFGLSALGVYPECAGDEQRCRAIRALAEGDAILLQTRWWQQYAGPQDYADIEAYRPPEQALPEESPPPFVLRDADLSYKMGYAFVKFLYDRDNWAGVNQAYTNLPQSTEQIMHPDLYLAGQPPLPVPAPSLADVLGAGWRQIAGNSLGEWMTYLILGYGADATAQAKDGEAAKAAAGWGGDHYQVFYNDSLSGAALAVQWTWDTPQDLTEFQTAIQFYLNERFRGAKIRDRTDGACWETNDQATCLFVKNESSLWLLAPDQAILNAVLTAYPDFR